MDFKKTHSIPKKKKQIGYERLNVTKKDVSNILQKLNIDKKKRNFKQHFLNVLFFLIPNPKMYL